MTKTRAMYWTAALAVLLVTIATATYSGLASTAVFFVLGLLLGKPRHVPPPDPLAALDSMPLSWADPEHPAYEPNPDVRDLIAQGWPVAQARDMVRVEGGDPDKGPAMHAQTAGYLCECDTCRREREIRTSYSAHGSYRVEVTNGTSKWGPVFETKEQALAALPQVAANANGCDVRVVRFDARGEWVAIVSEVPAPGTTRTVRFDFRDETLTNSGTRSRGRGTYRIEVTDRHGKSHWGPTFSTRESAAAALPHAAEALNEARARGVAAADAAHIQIVRLDPNPATGGKWTPC